MPSNRRKTRAAPLIRCHPLTASKLGAVPLRQPADAQKLGPACIPIRGHDGSCWAWPIEREFLAAIERR
ncbi:hypothetical protein [Microvirga sp. KLBC 81]|uniref:hypothetical protein n=1 Tax=Microvirga sp. KLBC 81 TaxID=1862707 RepID=UPI0010582129|nr:hypothetical protein [Microvirga sp. KLBC 81]